MSEGMLSIRVVTNAKHPGIVVENDTVTVRVKERPIDGAANEAVRRALAAALDVPQSSITLVRGMTARQKTFAVKGMTEREAIDRVRLRYMKFHDI